MAPWRRSCRATTASRAHTALAKPANNERADEGCAKVRSVAQVPQAGPQRPGQPLRRKRALVKRRAPPVIQNDDHRHEGERIDQKNRARAPVTDREGRHHQAAQRRPHRARQVVTGAVDRDGAGQLGRGTSSGTMACQAGLFMAAPMFSKKVSASSVHGEMMPANVSTLRTATVASIQTCQKISRRRRSTMSAVAPAG